jgi:hypothetical protein
LTDELDIDDDDTLPGKNSGERSSDFKNVFADKFGGYFLKLPTAM